MEVVPVALGPRLGCPQLLGRVPAHHWLVRVVVQLVLPLAAALGASCLMVRFLVLGPVGRPWLVAEWNRTWLAM